MKAITALKKIPRYSKISKEMIIKSYCPEVKLNLNKFRRPCSYGGPKSRQECAECWNTDINMYLNNRSGLEVNNEKM